MKSFGQWFKHSTTLKNIIFGLEIDSDAKSVKTDHLGIIFDGLSLSKSIQCFCFLALSSLNLPVNDLVCNSINNFIKSSKTLKMFALGNLQVTELQRSGLIGAIVSNPRINFLGLQFNGDDEKAVTALAEKLSKSKAKVIALGSKSHEKVDFSKLSKPEQLFVGGEFTK